MSLDEQQTMNIRLFYITDGENDLHACPSEEMMAALSSNDYLRGLCLIRSGKAWCMASSSETEQKNLLVQNHLFNTITYNHPEIMRFVLSISEIERESVVASLKKYLECAQIHSIKETNGLDFELMQETLEHPSIAKMMIVDDLFEYSLEIGFVQAAFLLVRYNPTLTPNVLGLAIKLNIPELVNEMLKLSKVDPQLKIFRDKSEADAYLVSMNVCPSAIEVFNNQTGIFPSERDLCQLTPLTTGRYYTPTSVNNIPIYCVATIPRLESSPIDAPRDSSIVRAARWIGSTLIQRPSTSIYNWLTSEKTVGYAEIALGTALIGLSVYLILKPSNNIASDAVDAGIKTISGVTSVASETVTTSAITTLAITVPEYKLTFAFWQLYLEPMVWGATRPSIYC
jgi:hypothetical protein